MFHAHYTDVPVIYVRVTDPRNSDRIAVRVRDSETGAYSLAEPEPQGNRGKIVPFLVKTKAERIVAELVYLPPIKADFLVETPKRENGKLNEDEALMSHTSPGPPVRE
jgi:hypothetical protein